MTLDALAKSNIPVFEVFPNSGGKPIPFLGGVAELKYYENILSETIRVTVTYVDTGNAAPSDDGTGATVTASDKLKITGTEKVYLELIDGQPAKNKLTFKTDDKALFITARSRISDKLKDVEILELVSEEYLRNESIRVVKRFDGKISDSVVKILTDDLKTKKDYEVEATKNKRSFIGTIKKPFWFLMWLASQSIKEGTSATGLIAGYFFYETHNGYKFKSIDGLFEQDPVKKYIHNNTSSMVVPPGYDGKILNYDITDSADIKDQLMMGTFNSSTNLFNSYESSFNCNPLNIQIQESAITAAGTEYGKNLNNLFISNPSRFFTPGAEMIGGLKPVEQSKEYDVVKSEYTASSASRYNQAFTVKVNITIAGDFSLEAGQIIHCDFPEQSSKTNTMSNPRMSGRYMISALCHRITPQQQSYTSLELIRDSYGRKPIKR
jgi:hypothetical protein